MILGEKSFSLKMILISQVFPTDCRMEWIQNYQSKSPESLERMDIFYYDNSRFEPKSDNYVWFKTLSRTSKSSVTNT